MQLFIKQELQKQIKFKESDVGLSELKYKKRTKEPKTIYVCL